jgi:putative nucleotidyltransferase with HDIG domain
MTEEIKDGKDLILKELIDPKFPIMERFRAAAPGTYKHSQNVANLVESIALQLNLDTDKMRVAAMYHDIGKINFPKAFAENQNGTNIHDKYEPEVSYNIITKHVGDSVLIMLQIKEMPRNIIEWVSQHHGSTILSYFYEKSKSKDDVSWRYKCSVPTCIEAAVLMICDHVEATAKSMASNSKLDTPKRKEDVVITTIHRLEMDGQLDKVLTGHLRVIKQVLINEMESLYHSRELYPRDIIDVTETVIEKE